MKFKKRKKSTRYRGSHTHKRGGKKKARGSGHRGGVGMAGTGKRGDQRKTLVLNLYGNDYFGKDKALRKKHKPKLKVINLYELNTLVNSLIKRGKAKEISKDKYEVSLEDYKILGKGEVTGKFIIKAGSASASVSEKIEKAGGQLTLKKNIKTSRFKSVQPLQSNS